MIRKLFFYFTIFLMISCKGTGKHADLKPLSIGILTTDDYSLSPTLTNDSLGLKVEVIRFESVTERNNALLTGKVDGIVTDFLDAVILEANSLPVHIAMKNDSSFHLIKSIGSDIRTPESLEGRNIAVEKNTIIEYITDRILQSAGISTDKGVNKADIKRMTLRLNLLQNGLIDAAVLPGKYAETAMEQGNSSLLSLLESDITAVVTMFSNTALTDKRREIDVFIDKHNASPPTAEETAHVTQWLKEKHLIP